MFEQGLSQEKSCRVMLRKYPDVLDVEQMCEILGICKKTGYGLLRDKKIQHVKIGRNYRIPKRFLLEYLQTGAIEE